MKKKIAIILTVIFTAIEAGLIAAMNYLNGLAYKKAGVNHHLIYKKGEYTFKYLNPQNIKIISIIVLVLIAIYLIWILKSYRKIGRLAFISALTAAMWCGVLEYVLHSEAVKEMLVYPYMVLAVIICILLATINTLLNRKMS